MKIGDLVQQRACAVFGSPEEWGLPDREAMVAKVRAFHGVGVIISAPRWTAVKPTVEILWSALGTTQDQPVHTVEVLNESR